MPANAGLDPESASPAAICDVKIPWVRVSLSVPGRTDVQCREKWSNILMPGLKKGKFSEEEDRCVWYVWCECDPSH
jgi:hypothetical protein